MRASGDRLSHQIIFIKCSEHDDSAVRHPRKDGLSRGNAVHSGHSDI